METLYGENCSNIPLLQSLSSAGTPVTLHLTAYHLYSGRDVEMPELMDIRFGMVPIILATDVIYVSPTGKRYVFKSKGSKPGKARLLPGDTTKKDHKTDSDERWKPNPFDADAFRKTSYNPKGETPLQFPKDASDDPFKAKSFEDIMKEDEEDKNAGDKPW